MTSYRYVTLSIAAIVATVFLAVYFVMAHDAATRAVQRQAEVNAFQVEFGQAQAAPGSRL
jgi:hypothetical protein